MLSVFSEIQSDVRNRISRSVKAKSDSVCSRFVFVRTPSSVRIVLPFDLGGLSSDEMLRIRREDMFVVRFE